MKDTKEEEDREMETENMYALQSGFINRIYAELYVSITRSMLTLFPCIVTSPAVSSVFPSGNLFFVGGPDGMSRNRQRATRAI